MTNLNLALSIYMSQINLYTQRIKNSLLINTTKKLKLTSRISTYIVSF